MTEEKERGIIVGNKYIYALSFSIFMAIFEYIFYDKMSLRDIVSTVLITSFFMLVLNWLVVKWEIWLDKKLDERRLRKAKLKDINS